MLPKLNIIGSTALPQVLFSFLLRQAATTDSYRLYFDRSRHIILKLSFHINYIFLVLIIFFGKIV